MVYRSAFRLSPFPTCQYVSTPSDEAKSNSLRETEHEAFQSIIKLDYIVATLQLFGFSLLIALTLIFWEDISMSHPNRVQYVAASSRPLSIGSSTVRGMAFGQGEGDGDFLLQSEEVEDTPLLPLLVDVSHRRPSYNEIMLKHRTERIPIWRYYEKTDITRGDVENAVRTIQMALLFLDDCKVLANNYEWDELIKRVRDPLLHSELEQACSLLKQARGILPVEARDEIGFEWGR